MLAKNSGTGLGVGLSAECIRLHTQSVSAKTGVCGSQVCVGGANLWTSGYLISVGYGRQRTHRDCQSQEQGAATESEVNGSFR